MASEIDRQAGPKPRAAEFVVWFGIAAMRTHIVTQRQVWVIHQNQGNLGMHLVVPTKVVRDLRFNWKKGLQLEEALVRRTLTWLHKLITLDHMKRDVAADDENG